jgi:hypothetical protein
MKLNIAANAGEVTNPAKREEKPGHANMNTVLISNSNQGGSFSCQR